MRSFNSSRHTHGAQKRKRKRSTRKKTHTQTKQRENGEKLQPLTAHTKTKNSNGTTKKTHTHTQIIASSNWLLVAQVLQLIAGCNEEELLPRS
jgi:hypothetical protein